MNINLNNLSDYVYKQTLSVIREVIDPQMNDDNDERRRQERQAKQIDDRSLNASDDPEEVEEAEEDAEENEESEDTPEDLDSGVPAPTGADPASPADKEKREDRTKGKGTADSPKLKTPSRKTFAEPTIGAVIDKLNALRGGKSLKDPTVKKSFSQYFEALTSSEREILLVFLTGLSQILAGVAQGGEAVDPTDIGLNVKGGVKLKAQKQKIPSPDEDESDEPTPIVVGESRYKQSNAYKQKALKQYRKYSK